MSLCSCLFLLDVERCSCAVSLAAVDPSWHFSAGPPTRPAVTDTPLSNDIQTSSRSNGAVSAPASLERSCYSAFQGDAVFTGCCSTLFSSPSCFWGPGELHSNERALTLPGFIFQQRKLRHVPKLTSTQPFESFDCSDVTGYK